MNLRPFRIEINRHPPFIGLFESSQAAFDAFCALAAAEAQTFNGFRLLVRPFEYAASLPAISEGGTHE